MDSGGGVSDCPIYYIFPILYVNFPIKEIHKLFFQEFLEFWEVLEGALVPAVWEFNALPEQFHFHSRVVYNQDP